MAKMSGRTTSPLDYGSKAQNAESEKIKTYILV